MLLELVRVLDGIFVHQPSVAIHYTPGQGSVVGLLVLHRQKCWALSVQPGL